MSAYQNLYNDVFSKLESNTSVIKTVDDFNDQYNNQEEFNNIKYPAVYVETGEVEWDKNENNYASDIYLSEPQSGIANIRLHIVYHTLKKYDLQARNEFFSIVEYVSNRIQKNQSGNRTTGTYSTLMRIKEEYITPGKQLRVAILTFETRLRDVFFEREDTVTENVTATINLSH